MPLGGVGLPPRPPSETKPPPRHCSERSGTQAPGTRPKECGLPSQDQGLGRRPGWDIRTVGQVVGLSLRCRHGAAGAGAHREPPAGGLSLHQRTDGDTHPGTEPVHVGVTPQRPCAAASRPASRPHCPRYPLRLPDTPLLSGPVWGSQPVWSSSGCPWTRRAERPMSAAIELLGRGRDSSWWPFSQEWTLPHLPSKEGSSGHPLVC